METRVHTAAVHAGRRDLRDLGVHAPPLDRSTTNPLTSLQVGTDSLDAMAAGGHPQGSSVYARLHNPTVARWEQAIARLESADEAVAYGSGMAAMTAVLLAAGAVGRHVVAVRPLYGCTDHLLQSGLLGCEVSWATPDGLAAAVRPDTALVVAETPANPTLRLLDLRAMVAAAGGVPVLVDNTFATPILQQPLQLGVTWSLHSATKALSGHGDVMAGVVATSVDRAAALRQVRILTGGLLDPQAAWLLHRSLPTLPLRVEAAQATAGVLAPRLADHPAVATVHYPGLPGADPLGLVGTQMAGPGGVLAFDLHGGYEAAAGVLKAVELLTPAVSLGSTDTLLQHPAGLTHRIVGDDARDAGGITPGMLRLSAGLEDVEDLWTDLAAALALVSDA
ncbi:cystathionine gamma-synthase [Egicoccus halophilus]|uniref:homocysteine desulfhydrase n=1 Tax=Egicoccus halophilus TaxID=1670830 RepID=A0A8J3A5Q1_9ACTN|nr:PLP-dependent aspartate aminotransferase family protein [Egicoccus halophilus]GGI03337.1 cystathionine gamma-synthase [Egicoccus halophilus]